MTFRSSKKTGVLEKRSAQWRPAADSSGAVADAATEGGQSIGRRVGQGGRVEVVPERLHGVQRGRIGRQPFHGQPTAVAGQGLRDQPAPMRGQAIPQEDHAAADMAPEGRQEPHHLGTAN